MGVLLSFIAFAWQKSWSGVRVKCPLPRPSGHSFVLLIAERFLLVCPGRGRAGRGFCCISKINYHLVLFATCTQRETPKQPLWLSHMVECVVLWLANEIIARAFASAAGFAGL